MLVIFASVFNIDIVKNMRHCTLNHSTLESPLTVRPAAKSLTSRELARMIGVSQSAVSRAFTPAASISLPLRQRILDEAARFGYEPDAIASTLSTRRSNIVGLVVSNLRNPFYPVLLEKLTRALQEKGQQTLLFNITPGTDVKQQLKALRLYSVDALIIVASTVLTSADLAWATEGRRAVLLNRNAPGTGIPSVSCDEALGARTIAEHFHERGAHRVGYVAGFGHTAVGIERRSAFISRAAELGMTLAGDVVAGEYSHAAGYRAALELARQHRPDAIMFASDILAMGGMDALRDEVGLAVPEDIMVAGFDDIEMASWNHYDLTTYRQPVDMLVASTVGHVVRQTAGEPPPAISRFAGELVTRSTTMRA